ncbi:MAG: hypothetical protein ACLQLG_11790 [Thermoguttaceae bacterium]
MIQLHDKTRRRICRAAFVSLCLVPTAVVAVWCVAWQLPGHKAAEIARLRQQTGMDVALTGLDHPRPGTLRYRGLTLSDPETGQAVLRCPQLEAAWTRVADAPGRTRTVVWLSAPEAEIAADGVNRLGQLLERILQDQGDWSDVEFHLSTGRLTLHCGDGPQTLGDVEGVIEAIRGGVQARAVFHPATDCLGSTKGGPAPSQAVRIRLTRNRQVTPPASGLELDTGGRPLPCSLLGIAWDEVKSLGAGSSFCGHVWANQTPGGWAAQIEGRLQGLDLAALSAGRLPQMLTGPAELSIHSARLWQGRVARAAGTLRAGPGLVGSALVRGAVRQLHLVSLAEPAPSGDLGYEQLALDFQVDARGVRLQGCCRGVEAGTVLTTRTGPLLAEPIAERQPVAALIQALVPAAEVQLSATAQAEWLARWLPLPEAAATAAPPPALPQARLRLGRPLER